MARSADDLARLLAVVSGATPDDPVASGPAFAYPMGATADLRGVRVGVPTNWFTSECDPAVSAVFEAALSTLESLGATRHDVSVDHAETAGIISWTITVAEFASMREADLDRLESITPSAAERAIGGLGLGSFDYLKALRARHLVQRGLDRAFADVDVILTPATPSVAPRFGVPVDWAFAGGDIAWLDRIARNFLIANITGVPALVCPAGFADGMPVGIQVLAPPRADGRCLRIGAAFQSVTDHHTLVPPRVA
jgi:aspartyl-tRNA(Asn)/glutamyl-tRNA(Gln) amidotransferase subunit A